MIAQNTFDNGMNADRPFADPFGSTGAIAPRINAADMNAALKSLLRNESLAFEQRLCRWRADADPRNDMEEALLQEVVHLHAQLERVKRAYNEQVRSHIASASKDEQELVHELGSRLYFNRVEHRNLYGTTKVIFSETTTSWCGKPVDPDDPAMLVRRLKSTGAGCRWLRNEWAALKQRLAPKKYWQSLDRYKCLRLLGHQPVDAIEDRCIAEIYIATRGIDPDSEGNAWVGLRTEMPLPAVDTYAELVRCRFTDLVTADQTTKCRQILIDLVDRNISELDALIAEHDAAIATNAERTFDRRSFDHSADGERLRRFELSCRTQYFQAIQLYRKIRGNTPADAAAAPTAEKPPEPLPTTTPRVDSAPKMPMQNPEAMKALAEPMGELIQDLLQESPLAWQLLQPYLPPSFLPAGAATLAQSTIPIPAQLQESLQAAVQPVGELIKDFLTHAP